MARHTETLNGGLWTAPDPARLEPGQLADARNCIYLAGSQALQRHPGRQSFGVVSATATAVVGLRDIQFDNADQYLVALAGTKYKTAPVGDSGSFTDLATLTSSPAQLEVAHFRNRFYLFNGASAEASSIGTNTVTYLSATAAGSALQTRQHGMLPVEAAPAVTTAGGGTFSQSVTGYYEYWTTEVAKLTQDGAEFVMEGSFQGSPTTTFISATSVVPTIQMPTVRNSITTHWRIYRSPKKDKESDKKFPSGFMISETATATASVADSSTVTTTSYAFPTSFNSGVAFSDAGNASAMGADDGNSATFATTGLFGKKSQGVYGFNLGGFAGNIRGIEVEIQGHVSSGTAPCPVEVTIGSNRNSTTGGYNGLLQVAQGLPASKTATKSGLITSTSAGAPTTIVLGSSSDRWIPSDKPGFVDSEFTAAGFMIVVAQSKISTTLSVDYVKIRVHYAATIDSVVPFPTVVYSFGDISAQVGKNGPPPSSTTGDFFEDSLVVNDVTNNSLVRWSYPGDAEAFPETFYLDMETRENDRVRAIRVVNDQLMCWLDSSTWRINYLPSERDSSFERGKAMKPVSTSYGCVHPMCVAVFSPGGGTDLAAFVSWHGIHATDGFSFETYTDGLNWGTILRPGATPIALINDRSNCILKFYFRNDSDYGSETYLCLPLCYGEGHWNGRPKVGGLIHMRNHAGGVFASLHSAWSVQRQNGAVSNYLGYGGSDTSVGAGKVYIETGTDIPALDPRIQYRSRTMYLAGEGSEWMLGEVYGYAFGYGATSPVVSYTASGTKTNDTGGSTTGAKTRTLAGSRLHKPGAFHFLDEGINISFAATASAYAQEYMILDGTGFDIEDSGK